MAYGFSADVRNSIAALPITYATRTSFGDDYADWKAEYAAESAPDEVINITSKMLKNCQAFPDAFGCMNTKTIAIVGAVLVGGYFLFKKSRRRR
jgi:hypothetical protein